MDLLLLLVTQFSAGAMGFWIDILLRYQGKATYGALGLYEHVAIARIFTGEQLIPTHSPSCPADHLLQVLQLAETGCLPCCPVETSADVTIDAVGLYFGCLLAFSFGTRFVLWRLETGCDSPSGSRASSGFVGQVPLCAVGHRRCRTERPPVTTWLWPLGLRDITDLGSLSSSAMDPTACKTVSRFQNANLLGNLQKSRCCARSRGVHLS